MSQKQKLIVDMEKIKQAVKMGLPISITTYTLPKEIETYIGHVASAFLTVLNQEDKIDYVTYCIHELTTNAKKANTKRIYFKEKGLDINNSADYETGMSCFKEETLSNIKHYTYNQKKAGLYIKITMQTRGSKIFIEVHNNVQMTCEEYKRVFDKTVRAKQFSHLEEAFTEVLDSSEGAGLGLVIMILMLKKVGLSGDCYECIVENGITKNRITIPRNTELKKQVESLTSSILKYIDDMPQFPEKIIEIQKAINEPDAKMSSIASLISADIGLTADLLKYVNSAAFGLAKKCMNIADAVKLVGLRGIQNLLYSIGSRQVLEAIDSEQSSLWNDAYRLAYYSYNLARMKSDRVIIENSYVCGLLHDLGKIVFNSMHPDTFQKINELCEDKNMSPQVLDVIMAGMEHDAIGAALAEKWDFPSQIVDTIRYQNNFAASPKENKDLVEVICFADFMRCFVNKKVDFYQIPKELLDKFETKSQPQFEELCKKFEEGFLAQN